MRVSNLLQRTLCAGLALMTVWTPAGANPVNCVDTLIRVELSPIVSEKPLLSADAEVLNLKRSAGTFASSPALDNGGWIDGIYACEVSLAGKTERVLVSFNGKSDGRTIYAVASLVSQYEAGTTKTTKALDRPFRGYGIGGITAAGYTGTTWNGQPFSFTLLGLEQSGAKQEYDVLRLAGHVGIDASRTAQLICKTNAALF